ncbi:MAG TPA: NTP transferase domain-containing protein, partial [Polyangiales bacterium]
WARDRAFDALLIVACDQLHLIAAHLGQLIGMYAYETDIVASQYAGTYGIPALFGRAWFSRLDELRGDRGAGALLRTYTATRAIFWPEGEVDIDTEGDVERHGAALR